jgi:hypothetical protein
MRTLTDARVCLYVSVCLSVCMLSVCVWMGGWAVGWWVAQGGMGWGGGVGFNMLDFVLLSPLIYSGEILKHDKTTSFRCSRLQVQTKN